MWDRRGVAIPGRAVVSRSLGPGQLGPLRSNPGLPALLAGRQLAIPARCDLPPTSIVDPSGSNALEIQRTGSLTGRGSDWLAA